MGQMSPNDVWVNMITLASDLMTELSLFYNSIPLGRKYNDQTKIALTSQYRTNLRNPLLARISCSLRMTACLLNEANQINHTSGLHSLEEKKEQSRNLPQCSLKIACVALGHVSTL